MKLILPAFAVALLLTGLSACHKEVATERIKEITIDTTIAAGSAYYLNLAPMGEEDDMASILDKGSLSSVSALENVSDVFTPVYHYSSSESASGTDHVVLAISQNPAGRAMVSKDSTIVYINLTLK